MWEYIDLSHVFLKKGINGICKSINACQPMRTALAGQSDIGKILAIGQFSPSPEASLPHDSFVCWT